MAIRKLTHREEAESLLARHAGQLDPVLSLLERQYATLQARAQVLLGLVTITLTITGFSGPAIAASTPAARIAVTSGLAFSLLASLLAILGVLNLRWVTALGASNDLELVTHLLVRRGQKTGFYRAALAVLAMGLGLYTSAAVLYLAGR
ncbi:MAG: hypothetical protein J0L75_15695 [Spirochaetes bacterium]|nr:hypothetical protein [Spirochaetota bacterium]